MLNAAATTSGVFTRMIGFWSVVVYVLMSLCLLQYIVTFFIFLFCNQLAEEEKADFFAYLLEINVRRKQCCFLDGGGKPVQF